MACSDTPMQTHALESSVAALKEGQPYSPADSPETKDAPSALSWGRGVALESAPFSFRREKMCGLRWFSQCS